MLNFIVYGLISILGLVGAYFFIFGEMLTPSDKSLPPRSTGDLGPGVPKVHPKCPTCTCEWIDPTGRI